MGDLDADLRRLVESIDNDLQRVRLNAALLMVRSLKDMAGDLAGVLGQLMVVAQDGEIPNDEAVAAGQRTLLAWQQARAAVDAALAMVVD